MTDISAERIDVGIGLLLNWAPGDRNPIERFGVRFSCPPNDGVGIDACRRRAFCMCDPLVRHLGRGRDASRSEVDAPLSCERVDDDFGRHEFDVRYGGGEQSSSWRGRRSLGRSIRRRLSNAEIAKNRGNTISHASRGAGACHASEVRAHRPDATRERVGRPRRVAPKDMPVGHGTRTPGLRAWRSLPFADPGVRNHVFGCVTAPVHRRNDGGELRHRKSSGPPVGFAFGLVRSSRRPGGSA
ncbi:MAG: hypothetical protein EOP66_01710 [Sphingomonas sp.]|nr:MAG: hypothetical protein EOP66_01710 [Sphingomonas sp.]